MAASKVKTINLLTREGFEHTQLGQIFDWLLTAGRSIVVVTELVVIAAFLSRFWLDKTLTDLNEQNTLKKVQVEASLPFENDFKTVQSRLVAYKTLETSRINSITIVKGITKLLPAGVALDNITFSNEQITLRGTSLSEGGTAGFVKALEQNNYKNPTLTQVSLDTAGQQRISFSIKTSLGGKNGN